MSEPTAPAPGESPTAGRKLRIGTSEREATIARLQVALSEGRLEIAELDERMAEVYAARTVDDLVPITADLPVAEQSVPPPLAVGRGRNRQRSRERYGDEEHQWLFWAWRAWASAVLINVVIWLAVSVGNGFETYFWPIWVAGPWGAILLVNTLFRRLG